MEQILPQANMVEQEKRRGGGSGGKWMGSRCKSSVEKDGFEPLKGAWSLKLSRLRDCPTPPLLALSHQTDYSSHLSPKLLSYKIGPVSHYSVTAAQVPRQHIFGSWPCYGSSLDSYTFLSLRCLSDFIPIHSPSLLRSAPRSTHLSSVIPTYSHPWPSCQLHLLHSSLLHLCQPVIQQHLLPSQAL